MKPFTKSSGGNWLAGEVWSPSVDQRHERSPERLHPLRRGIGRRKVQARGRRYAIHIVAGAASGLLKHLKSPGAKRPVLRRGNG
ncbi:MAG: hypothetical protein R2729_32115 [Bryobacteraceae bacterium]